MNKVRSYSMASSQRLKSLLDAVTYVSNNNINGDIIECGVWKGGGLMAITEKLKFYHDLNRIVWAFDTFEGMTVPEDHDVDLNDIKASVLLDELIPPLYDVKCMCSYEEATTNILSTGYPKNNLRFIKGDIKDTLPMVELDKIAILHLDTDWYASTKIELEYLYPKLVKGGVLIIDDYGHWKGCKQAVDEYFALHEPNVKMIEIDYTARLIIKD